MVLVGLGIVVLVWALSSLTHKPTAGPPTNKNAPIGTGSLLPEEQTLLKLASNKYYYNREGVVPGSPYEHPLLMRGYINIPIPNAHSEVAIWVDFKQKNNDIFYEATDKLSPEAAKLTGKWDDTVDKTMEEAFKEALKEILLGKDPLSFDEFRRGPGKSWEEWGNVLRKQEIARAKSLVAMSIGANKIARFADDYFGPRVAKAPFSTPMPVTIYPHWGDEVGVMYNGKRVYVTGWYAKITYQGKEPLTNVMLVSHVATNGPSTTLTEGQNLVLATNRLTYGLLDSDGDGQIEQIEKMFKVQNYYATMPKSMFVFFPVLKPGDVVHMPMGDSELNVQPKGRLSIYSDQGYLKDRPLEMTRWMLNGCSKDVVDVIKPGMSREAVTTQLGELDKTDRAAWLAAGKNKTLPEDADFCRWGRSQYQPVLYLAFRGDTLDTLELVIPPRQKPANPGIPLKLDGKGAATVKAALTKDDPPERMESGPCKVYTVQLQAGKTYIIKAASLALEPGMRIDDEYGDRLGAPATRGQAPRTPKARPLTPRPFEATKEFTPKEDGVYRIVVACERISVARRPGEFTLTVEMK